MRRPRLRAPSDFCAFYHCVSRVVDRRKVLGSAEKEYFTALMREAEAFCEVRVLTHCVMSNHFHVLVEVPARPAVLPSAEQMVEKLRGLSGHQDVEGVRQQFEAYRQEGDGEGERQYLARFHARLWDLGFFMKLLKQRFSQWYNRRNGRRGTLWEERYRSVLVEGEGQALVTMAAYIDLNPVRAGLVADPKDYRWSGYGEAMAGGQRAQEGVVAIVRALERGGSESVRGSLEMYRIHLYREGNEEREGRPAPGTVGRKALSREAALAVLQEKGRLPASEYLRCRVRYFCDGMVLGSRPFVEGLFQRYRHWFGPKRTDGARPLRGLASETPLFTFRDLRVRRFE